MFVFTEIDPIWIWICLPCPTMLLPAVLSTNSQNTLPTIMVLPPALPLISASHGIASCTAKGMQQWALGHRLSCF